MKKGRSALKRVLCVVFLFLFLAGCGKNTALDDGMRLRNQLLQGSGCAFDACITADYGEKAYTFSLHCQADTVGNLSFTVTAPASVAGITGTVEETGGKLTFDEKALAFPTIADGLITPVGAPWMMVHAMMGGFIRGCEEKKDGTHIIIDDTYRQNTVQIELYCDQQHKPVRGEIVWEGRRIIAIDVTNFVFL